MNVQRIKWTILCVRCVALPLGVPCSLVAAEIKIVVPNERETTEGDYSFGGGNIVGSPFRIQALYPASNLSALSGLPASRRQLVGYAERPDRSQEEAASLSYVNYEVRISTTSKTTLSVNDPYDSNFGDEVILVYAGPITRSTLNAGPSVGPKEFDILTNFQTPFIYDPSVGNLLLDIRSNSGRVGTYTTDWDTFPGANHVVFNIGDATSASPTDVATSVAIRRFVFVPEPTTLALAAIGMLPFVVYWRRRSRD